MGESHLEKASDHQKQRARELDVAFSANISGDALDLLIAARCGEPFIASVVSMAALTRWPFGSRPGLWTGIWVPAMTTKLAGADSAR
jgi:hypothetical protein